MFWEKDPNFVQDLTGEVRELDLSLYYNYVFGCSLEKKLLNFVTTLKRKHKKAQLKQVKILTFRELFLPEDRVSMGIVPRFAYYLFLVRTSVKYLSF